MSPVAPSAESLPVDQFDLTLIADRVARMAPPATSSTSPGYLQGHADALCRVEGLLRWLARGPQTGPEVSP